APLCFALALLLPSFLLPPSQHRLFDLLLAAVETVLTFSIAYPASVVLGTVLLQTSPERGLPGGRMEAFLRTMRENEALTDYLFICLNKSDRTTPPRPTPPRTTHLATHTNHLAILPLPLPLYIILTISERRVSSNPRTAGTQRHGRYGRARAGEVGA
ncbi:hypothetical protein BD410DRAFT_781799, partial [Rickenella mellea]